MSYINLNPPPAVRTYTYTVDNRPLTSVSDSEVASMEAAVGSKINPDYEKGLKRTPFQKNRLLAITLFALAAITTVGASIALAMTGAILLVIPVVLGAALLIGSGSYLACQGKDLDSPSVRQQVIQDLATQTFYQINKNRQFTNDQLIGYGLLDGASTGMKDYKKRAKFYARFTNLQSMDSQLKGWKSNQIADIDALWNTETFPIRDWQAREQQIIDQQIALMDHQEHSMRMHTHIHEHHTRRPAVGLRVATAAVSVSNYMTECQLRQRSREINSVYTYKMQPWDTWRSQSIANVRTVYQGALAEIEKQYDWMKSAAA